MIPAKLREWLYFELLSLRGQPVGTHYHRFLREYRTGIPLDTTRGLLVGVLSHCMQSVPYYRGIMQEIGASFNEDPEEYLRHFPILTKEIIRNRFNDLKSDDLNSRKWYLNTTGGSTGEPVQFIQDYEYASKSGAIKLIYSWLAGGRVGESEIKFWGSIRDIMKGTDGWKADVVNKLSNIILINSLCINPKQMRDFINLINEKRPKLIVAYVNSIYEIARFSRQEGLKILPQVSMITSAGTLHPFMRETIEEVFKCRVFNKYGSREVGDIAGERQGCQGLWVAPWGNYVEIVDNNGNPVPDGTCGEILVTSLTNYAMPFIRYKIGDFGALLPVESRDSDHSGQLLMEVLGRNTDMFRTRDGTQVAPCYFDFMLSSRKWIRRYQVIQKKRAWIVFKIVCSGRMPRRSELEEIETKTKMVMGDDCLVSYEFVDHISASPSGKFRYTISLVDNDTDNLEFFFGSEKSYFHDNEKKQLA